MPVHPCIRASTLGMAKHPSDFPPERFTLPVQLPGPGLFRLLLAARSACGPG